MLLKRNLEPTIDLYSGSEKTVSPLKKVCVMLLDTKLHKRSIFMYGYGSLFSAFPLFVNLFQAGEQSLIHWDMANIGVILNGAFGGLIVSCIISSLSNIAKTLISSVSLIVSAFLSWIIFGETISVNYFASSIVVCVAILIYNDSAVHSKKEIRP